MTFAILMPQPSLSLRRRLREAQRSLWRQSLPRIEDPTEAEADRAALIRLQASRERVVIEGEVYLRAKDGTYQPESADPYRGLRTVAAGAALGLAKTHATITQSPGMITVTLIQPPKAEEASIRAKVTSALLATSTDSDFDAVAKKVRARKAEKQLAQRVSALRHVGDRTDDEREIRHRVGVQVREIRSV